MSLLRPDYWIPHLSNYAFGVIDHTKDGDPVQPIQGTHPLDYVVSIFVTVALFTGQLLLLNRLIYHGRRWHLNTKKELRVVANGGIQANRSLLALLITTFLGALTSVTCILLLVNFMMRIWSLGWVRYPNEPMVNWTADTQKQRVNCSTGNTHCMSWSKSFGFAVGGLEKVTAFFMQTLVFVATCLLAYRGIGISKNKALVAGLSIVFLTVFAGSTLAAMATVYRDPFEWKSEGGWLYYPYHSSDPTQHTYLAVTKITLIVSTVALVVLNAIFTISVIRTRMKAGARFSALVFEAALPSAVAGITLFFIPIYGIESGAFFYMRKVRYTLRMLWASLLIIAPQHLFVKALRAEACKDQLSDEKTLNEADTDSVNKV